MGKTFKDRRKFDRKHDKNDGLKEVKREHKKKWHQQELTEEFDEDEYDTDE